MKYIMSTRNGLLLALWKSLSRVYSFRPHGLYSPWKSPGQNTGVGSLSLLQGIFPTQWSKPGFPHCRQILYQLSHKGSPIISFVCCAYSLSHVWLFATSWTIAHQAPLSMGILQARILEWVAMPSSKVSSQPRDRIQVSRIAGRFFTIWATRKVHY